MAELLGTVFTVERYVVAGAAIVGLATLATALLPYVTGSPHRRLQNAIGYRLVEATDRKLPACLEGI